MKMSYYALLMSIIVCAISCAKDDPVVQNTITSVTVRNLPADPGTGRDPNTGALLGAKNLFTFFRFSDSTIVPNSDSATLKWDIGFKGNIIIINSGISGPGNAGAYLYNGLFTELKEVPVDSIFKMDVSASTLAIGKAWYTYNPASMVLHATPGKTIVIRTTDNKYVKMEILSYYKNAPANPNASTDQDRYYTFRYVYQANGDRRFE